MTHASDSYDPRFFEPLFAIEDKHFWFRARNKAIAGLVRGLVQQFQPGYYVLEIGCGTGNTLRQLEQACAEGIVLGMDLFHEGLSYARHRVSCPLIQGDMRSPPFGAQFDLIGLFDVLEHLPDDAAVLRVLYGMLKPNGYMMLTVPAHMSLWSYFDEAARHYRRYEYAELQNKMDRAGYRVEFLTPYMASLFPLVWLGRRVATRLSGTQDPGVERAHQMAARDLRSTPVLNDALMGILSLEAHWIAQRRRLPIGASLLAVARKG